MRKPALALVIIAACNTSVLAQNAPWAQKLFFGVTNHDFGSVPHGAKLKHRFKIRNIYAVPLTLTSIRASCRCLTFTTPKRKLAPKEESHIDIVMDAATFKGPKVITLHVTVGPSFISTATIQVSANARTDVVFNPGSVNFGATPAGATPTHTIDVEYAGSQDWRIVEVVKNKRAPFDVSVRELYRNRGGLFRTGKIGYQMLVTLKSDASPGPFQQDLLLKTNDRETPLLTVAVEGTVQAALTARPKVVDLGTVKIGQQIKQRVVVRGIRPFHIKSIDGTSEGLKAEIPSSISPLHVITITCQPQKTGVCANELHIRTDRGEVVTVTVRANVVK